MSASRCLTAWNEPIGRPNCSRSLAYGGRELDGGQRQAELQRGGEHRAVEHATAAATVGVGEQLARRGRRR